FKLASSAPSDGATEVRMVPPRITLDFTGEVDRAAVEAGLAITGTPDARTYYHWSGRGAMQRLEVLLDRPFHHWADHAVTVPISGGTQTVRFKTRATTGDYAPAAPVKRAI